MDMCDLCVFENILPATKNGLVMVRHAFIHKLAHTVDANDADADVGGGGEGDVVDDDDDVDDASVQRKRYPVVVIVVVVVVVCLFSAFAFCLLHTTLSMT